MLNIAKLKNSKSNKPYTLPLKARVGGVSGAMHYQVDGGEKKEYKIIGVADSTGAIKCILYDRTKEKNFAEGKLSNSYELHLQNRAIRVNNHNKKF